MTQMQFIPYLMTFNGYNHHVGVSHFAPSDIRRPVVFISYGYLIVAVSRSGRSSGVPGR